ncbi:MAG: beta-galactosidase [Candidatus Brocadiia bacterium]
MPDRYPPVSAKCPHILHGGDYNPDQWLHAPEVWDEDLRLMKLARCNAMSVGIFAWAALEPEEGRYTFGWLDRVMDGLHANGIYAVLATPSAARPAWMSEKYPEVRRMRHDGTRIPHGRRQNHCPSSPVYREKCAAINTRLAERYGQHPALLAWHVSNEYGSGECHCELCYAAFRRWLRRRYDDDLEALNRAWWTAFWSHTFTDWEQVRPLDGSIHGLMLDWRRFLSDHTIDFYRTEAAPLRRITPEVAVTTNFMGLFPGLNYWAFAREVDVVSWDAYPEWHNTGDDVAVAAETAFVHDLYRCLKGGRPFMLMECTPSVPTRPSIKKRKRPGMHRLASLQAVAHGSDTVQYFQWRKGRGGIEKFHGAVVDHCGHEHTRVFREVAQLGEALARLDPLVGTTAEAQAAIVFDWETRWAAESAQFLAENTRYTATCQSHYRPFWDRGVTVDIVDETCDFSPYRLLVAPMLYMLRGDVAERIRSFVAAGGTLVLTYWSGIVDEHDLCHLGGFPGGGLREVVGVWDEELDSLQPFDRNTLVMAEANPLGIAGTFELRELCSVVHVEGAEVLATYGQDYYAGQPALTVNAFGQGRAYYLAARPEARFLDAFYGRLIDDLGLAPALEAELPPGVTAQARTDGQRRYVFVLNFTTEPKTVALGQEAFRDLLSGEGVSGELRLDPYGVAVLEPA